MHRAISASIFTEIKVNYPENESLISVIQSGEKCEKFMSLQIKRIICYGSDVEAFKK